MISSHRKAHRAIFAVLAVVVPVLLIAGIDLRPTVPPVSDDDRLFLESGFAPSPVAEQGEVEIGQDGLSFALAGSASGGDVTIRPLSVIAKPDLLVYWSADAPADASDAQQDLADRLDDAVLVGSLSGRSRRALRLPEDADGGHLIVYSLGYGELLADLPLAQLADAATASKTSTATE